MFFTDIIICNCFYIYVEHVKKSETEVESLLKNRWNCTTAHERNRFSVTMYLISSTTLFLFILMDRMIGFGYRVARLILDENGIFRNFLSSISDEEFNMLASNLIAIIAFWGACIISFAVLMLFLKRISTKADFDINNRVSFRFKMPKNTVALLFVGLGVVYFFATIAFGFDFALSRFGVERRTFDGTAFFPGTGVGVFIYFFAYVVSPSILEEFLCRYLMLNALRKYGDGFAITVSSVFFGLLHGNVNQFFFTTAIGFFLAYYAIKTKSIWFPIILHVFINSSAMFWSFMSYYSSEELFTLLSSLIMTIIFGISAIYMIWLIKTRYDFSLKPRQDYVPITRRQKIVGFFNVATIIFIVIAIWQSMGAYYISGAYW